MYCGKNSLVNLTHFNLLRNVGAMKLERGYINHPFTFPVFVEAKLLYKSFTHSLTNSLTQLTNLLDLLTIAESSHFCGRRRILEIFLY